MTALGLISCQVTRTGIQDIGSWHEKARIALCWGYRGMNEYGQGLLQQEVFQQLRDSFIQP
jgi:hypothetical protein